MKADEPRVVHDGVTGEAFVGTEADLARENARYKHPDQPAQRAAWLAEQGRRNGKNTDLAMRWALVKFVVDLDVQRAEDKANACEENGWLMRDASGLYTDVIATLTGLATGEIDAEVYLEAERQEALRKT